MSITIKNENRNRRLVLIVSFLTLFLTFRSSNSGSVFLIGGELFWWLIQLVFLGTLFQLKSAFGSPATEKNLFFVKLYLFWSVICIARGTFEASNYWEWKFLVTISFVLLLPLLAYVVHNTQAIQSIAKTWFRYALYLFIVISPFLYGDGVGRFLMPVTFLSLFFSILSTKWKMIVFGLTVYVIAYDLTARSNVIKFFIPFVIGNLVYFKTFRSVTTYNISRLLLLFAPFLFFFLAVSGVFNVFKMNEYIGEYSVKGDNTAIALYDVDAEQNLTTDTRTFLYVEVLESALNNNYVVFGRTPARGNDSASFGDYLKETLQTGKQERFGNEVSILNIFTWLGTLGVLLYFLVFMKATYLAINQSNNIFIKLIGLNVAFRWAYGWVEDFSVFDLSNIFLWAMIGMCYSESFRSMTNKEFKAWVLGIFEKKPKPLKIVRRYNPPHLRTTTKSI